METPLGIVAGGGDLPKKLVQTCRDRGRPVFVIALEGQTGPDWLGPHIPHAWVRLGAMGKAVEALKTAGCEEIVLIGPVRRPSMLSLVPDAEGRKFLAKVGKKALGDDSLLSAIVGYLEAAFGFRVLALEDVMACALERRKGALGAHAPDDQAFADIARGVEVLRALGAVDVGQAVVVQQGLVLGVEALEGTDALLERAGALRRPGPGGVLVKGAKPGQETKVDRPTVGPATVRGAAAAGLAGIALDSGETLLVEPDEAVALADEAGLFLYGRDPAADAPPRGDD